MKKIRKWFRKLVKTKVFHICVIIAIIAALIAFAYITIMKYNVEGEKEMPFEVSKINVISSVTGENVVDEINSEAPGALNNPEMEQTPEQSQARWDLNVSQNNDFYIYIEKNENYNGRTEEIIDTVTIDNFEINKNTQKGENKIYKPDEKSEKELFKNAYENEVDKIEYVGASESKIKNLQMSNQGDLIYFRYTNKNVGRYTSNDEELNYNELFQKIGMKEEELKVKVKFNMAIKLTSGKIFRTTVDTEVPVEGVVEKGTSSGEIIDTNKLIFKRN